MQHQGNLGDARRSALAPAYRSLPEIPVARFPRPEHLRRVRAGQAADRRIAQIAGSLRRTAVLSAAETVRSRRGIPLLWPEVNDDDQGTEPSIQGCSGLLRGGAVAARQSSDTRISGRESINLRATLPDRSLALPSEPWSRLTPASRKGLPRMHAGRRADKTASPGRGTAGGLGPSRGGRLLASGCGVGG